MVWADSITIDTGDVRLGLRTNSRTHTELVRRIFAPHVIDDSDAPPNFSVQFSSSPNRAHILYRGECPVLRTFDPHRIIHGMRIQLDSYAPLGRLVAVESLGLVDPTGGATLLPATASDRLKFAERPLRTKGIRPIETVRLPVDLEQGEIVLEHRLQTDDSAISDTVSQLPEPRRREPFVGSGRYPINRWVRFDHAMHKTGGLSAARAVVRAWHALADDRAVATEKALLQLVQLCGRVPFETTLDPGRRLVDLFEVTHG